MGAALLAGRAALKSGAGKLTIHAPRIGEIILQTGLPEALYDPDPHQTLWSSGPETHGWQALAIGCGIGTNPMTRIALGNLLRSPSLPPLVLDADALNLLASDPRLMDLLPPGTVLTPHPGEFDRLTGHRPGDWERLCLAAEMAIRYQVIVVLKGAYTRICTPGGWQWINPTGNPGMATAGSGDVLTGIIAGLLAQGATPVDAAVAGVYLHGLAGDLAVSVSGSEETLIAGDITGSLGRAFHHLHQAEP